MSNGERHVGESVDEPFLEFDDVVEEPWSFHDVEHGESSGRSGLGTPEGRDVDERFGVEE